MSSTFFRVMARSLSVAVLAFPLFVGVAQAQTAAPTAAPAAVAVAPAKADASKAAENPYGIGALWETSDVVAKTVLLILAIMSMGSWYILVIKMLEQRKIGAQAKEAANKFWSAGTVTQGAAALAKDSPYQFIAASGLCLLYTSPSPRDGLLSRMPSSA